MFLKGECANFPDSWSDRMWGPDDLPNQRTQYDLRRAAVRICEACPVRAECLAFGIMTSTASTADCPCAPDARC